MTQAPAVAALSPEDEVAREERGLGPMAGSRTEVCWAEPGLGKRPQRRRWAWAEEEKDADGERVKGPPFPGASSPELLEDFRLGQQCLQPPVWGPDSPPAQCRDSQSGESAGEGETGARPTAVPPSLPPPGGRWGLEGVLVIFFFNENP